MSQYDVVAIDLAALSDIHGGTGRQESSNWVVVPDSVPPSGNLRFEVANADVTTMLYAIDKAVVPNWFGVAVPSGLTDFTRPHVFYHPLPAQAGYVDAQYQAKAGMWPQLFYYMERLGNQLDEAHRSQVIVMPFLTEAAQDTGIFAPNWSDILTDILTDVRARMGADDGTALEIQQLVVSSFSVGIVYSRAFRLRAPGLASVLAEVWDFDGAYSSESAYSNELTSTSQYAVIKYDQHYSTDSSAYHVPPPRWANYVQPPTSGNDVHGLIRDFMFFHASTVSGVGALIEAAPPGTGEPSTGEQGTGEPGTTISRTGQAGSGTPVTSEPGPAQTGITGPSTAATGGCDAATGVDAATGALPAGPTTGELSTAATKTTGEALPAASGNVDAEASGVASTGLPDTSFPAGTGSTTAQTTGSVPVALHPAPHVAPVDAYVTGGGLSEAGSSMPGVVGPPPVVRADGWCCPPETALVALVATTSATALTAIAAIATAKRRRFPLPPL